MPHTPISIRTHPGRGRIKDTLAKNLQAGGILITRRPLSSES